MLAREPLLPTAETRIVTHLPAATRKVAVKRPRLLAVTHFRYASGIRITTLMRSPDTKLDPFTTTGTRRGTVTDGRVRAPAVKGIAIRPTRSAAERSRRLIA